MTRPLERLAGERVLPEGLLAPASAEALSEIKASVLAIDPACSGIPSVLKATKRREVTATPARDSTPSPRFAGRTVHPLQYRRFREGEPGRMR